MIVDDDRIAEQNTGDYFPWWFERSGDGDL